MWSFCVWVRIVIYSKVISNISYSKKDSIRQINLPYDWVILCWDGFWPEPSRRGFVLFAANFGVENTHFLPLENTLGKYLFWENTQKSYCQWLCPQIILDRLDNISLRKKSPHSWKVLLELTCIKLLALCCIQNFTARWTHKIHKIDTKVRNVTNPFQQKEDAGSSCSSVPYFVQAQFWLSCDGFLESMWLRHFTKFDNSVFVLQ